MPYRTLENRIEGVVITFTNITISKKLELELQKTKLDLENLLTTQMVTYQLKSITDKTSGED
jgi:two-component system CheB/CheR fusion protein